LLPVLTLLCSIAIHRILAELVNPAASAQAAFDCKTIAEMGLNAKVLAHTRCNMGDVQTALDAGVDGVNLYMCVHALSIVRVQHPGSDR
jgi:homocitrate synthase